MCSPDSAAYAHNEWHTCPCEFPSLNSPECSCIILVLGAAIIVLYFLRRKRR